MNKLENGVMGEGDGGRDEEAGGGGTGSGVEERLQSFVPSYKCRVHLNKQRDF